MTIRPAVPADLPAISELLVQFGYPVLDDALGAVFTAIQGDHRHALLVAEEIEHGIVGMLVLSSRPVLRLQGWIGTIEELVVRRGLRGRGIGDRLIQFAKGLSAERGWVRLEVEVARKRESNRRSFLFSRGFVSADSVRYRWGVLEGRHRARCSLSLEGHLPENT